MRIEFLTQEDPIYILPFFEEFIRNYAGSWDITRISCCRTMGNRPRRQMVRELTQLYGVSGMMRLASRIGVARLMGAVPFRRGAAHYYSISQLCRAYNIEWTPIGNPNAPEFTKRLEEGRCDLLISVACPFILKQSVLERPPLGCINIHHAPLPRYKGMMPTFWQLYQGERRVGLTIHSMTAKIDEGVALLQDSLPVQPDETLDHLIRRSKRHAAHRLAEVLQKVGSESSVAQRLDQELGSYFTFPTQAEIRQFHQRGLRAI
jgi:methionyl-tRNA formyltransferase